jgi:hypothetical protein
MASKNIRILLVSKSQYHTATECLRPILTGFTDWMVFHATLRPAPVALESESDNPQPLHLFELAPRITI